MNLIILLGIAGVVLITAYFTYGTFILKKLKVTDDNVTPAHTLRDGVDFVPSKTVVVLGHHFASIAGAGPIVGPIIAVTFGWIPAVIWILVGGIFFGAVHDTASMVASMRHGGKSIGGIIQKYIGKKGKRLFLIFGFATLILIIAVFADIIAKTFVNDPGVASASILFIGLAIVFGMIIKRVDHKKGAFVIASLVGVVLMYYFVYLGTQLPFGLSYLSWVTILLAYAFVASVTPISLLLQPRDYLSSFLLYGLIISAVIGIVVLNPEIQMDSNVQFNSENLGYLFPVLFITVACGAISGFHSMVASGTTSKQINKESDVKIVGYGGMLIESFLAIISVGAVIILTRADYSSRLIVEGPVTLFADGLGGIISSIGLSSSFAITFVALAVSAFALTTLDTCTRLARFLLQEYFDDIESTPGRILSGNRYIATGIVVLCSVLLLSSGEFTALWPVFGSANQLLAALALLTVAVWLIKTGVRPTFVLVPMSFMFLVTLSSLLFVAVRNYNQGVYVLSIIAGILFALAVVVLFLARSSLKKEMALEKVDVLEEI